MFGRVLNALLIATPQCKYYDGPEGPLFSSMVSCKVFSKSDIVLGSVKQFQEIFRQFWEVSNSSQKF